MKSSRFKEFEKKVRYPIQLISRSLQLSEQPFHFVDKFGDLKFSAIDSLCFMYDFSARIFLEPPKRKKYDKPPPPPSILPEARIDLNQLQDQFNNNTMEEEKQEE